GLRRLHQRELELPRFGADADGRQRDRGELHRTAELPGDVGPVGAPHGRHPGHRRGLRASKWDGGPGVSGTISPTIVEAAEATKVARPRRGTRGFSFGKWALPIYSAIALIFLLTPIVYTFVFSFNDSVKSYIVWVGFTFDNWLNVCEAQGV